MAEIRSDESDDASGAEGKKKKRQLTGLLFAGVLLLSALLPPRYKAFSPLLFLLLPLFDVLNRLRSNSIQTGSSQGNGMQSSDMSQPSHSGEPYSYEPRNPKDPRKYKPIG